jgi:thioredoxin reductase
MPDGVAVIGGGPSGLAAATRLRELGVGQVTVIERETKPGGIPRHCAHTGFGVRDLRRLCGGPSYARRHAELAQRAGAELMTETMVTGIADGRLQLTGPEGRTELDPPAVVLATGCRERPRSARLVPGSRPGGVMTTATLQQLVHLHGERVAGRAIVVGAEHVSFSAIATLAHAGASVLGLVTELERHQTLGVFRFGAWAQYGVRVWTRTRLAGIFGSRRVEAVELEDLHSGRTRTVPCELVIFTADWIPDHELAVMAGCELDPGTRGPGVDAGLRTSAQGVFAAGNVLHPAETADIAALGGRHVAAQVRAFLAAPGDWPQHVPVHAEPPLIWVAPNLVSGDGVAPPRERFLLRSSEFLRRPAIEVRQGERTLWRGRVARLVPGRSAHIPSGWTAQTDAQDGPVSVAVAGGATAVPR